MDILEAPRLSSRLSCGYYCPGNSPVGRYVVSPWRSDGFVVSLQVCHDKLAVLHALSTTSYQIVLFSGSSEQKSLDLRILARSSSAGPSFGSCPSVSNLRSGPFPSPGSSPSTATWSYAIASAAGHTNLKRHHR